MGALERERHVAEPAESSIIEHKFFNPGAKEGVLEEKQYGEVAFLD